MRLRTLSALKTFVQLSSKMGIPLLWEKFHITVPREIDRINIWWKPIGINP